METILVFITFWFILAQALADRYETTLPFGTVKNSGVRLVLAPAVIPVTTRVVPRPRSRYLDY
jgi:hypothetical protein